MLCCTWQKCEQVPDLRILLARSLHALDQIAPRARLRIVFNIRKKDWLHDSVAPAVLPPRAAIMLALPSPRNNLNVLAPVVAIETSVLHRLRHVLGGNSC